MKIEVDVNRQLGELMRAMRMSAGKTQGEVAEACGVGRTQIVNIESGRMCNVLLSHLVKTGDACGFEVTLTVKKKGCVR